MKRKPVKFWPVLMAALLLGGVGFLISCEKYVYQAEVINPGETILFETQIQPIFTNHCITCHKGIRNPDLRDGNSYTSLTTGGYVNLPAETSRLYKQVTSSSHGSYTIDTEKQLILLWIQQGAQNNK